MQRLFKISVHIFMNKKKIGNNFVTFLALRFLDHGIINSLITIRKNVLKSDKVVLKICTKINNRTVITINLQM